MKDIKVDEALWASSMLPEGIVERWFIADGAVVAAGDLMAEGPDRGRLARDHFAGERSSDDYRCYEHGR